MIRESVPFFHVRDIAASLRFYEALGFTVRQKWEPGGSIRWCRLQAGGASLMLQSFAESPATAVGMGVSVCFMCDDALEVYRDARARGLSPREPFVGNGLWVTALTDPDGYRVDFESPTDVPEDTTLSEWEPRSSQ